MVADGRRGVALIPEDKGVAGGAGSTGPLFRGIPGSHLFLGHPLVSLFLLASLVTSQNPVHLSGSGQEDSGQSPLLQALPQRGSVVNFSPARALSEPIKACPDLC